MAVNDDYLIDTLMNMGAVDSAQVDAARPAAEAANAGVVDTLIVQKVLDPDRIVHARAMQFGSEVVDLGDVKVKDDLLKALPRHIARRYQVVPVEYDGSTLTVAMADPSDIDATDGLNRLLDVGAIIFKVASETQIKEAIDKFYGSSDEAVERYDYVTAEISRMNGREWDGFVAIDCQSREDMRACQDERRCLED